VNKEMQITNVSNPVQVGKCLSVGNPEGVGSS